MIRNCNAVILMYHSISDGPPPLCIPAETFTAQMNWLKENANVLPLVALVESLARDRVLPKNTVALTFDDGFSDFSTEAAPVLRRLNLPAIVFLPAAYCGKSASWDTPAGGRPLLTWEQIRDLKDQGFDVGSHGMNHLALSGLSEIELGYEITESKHLIDREIGQNTCFFCYPYGCFDERIRRAVSTCYSGGACSTELRPLIRADDPFALPRVDVYYLRNLQIFRLLFTERLRLYLRARRFIRELRQARFPKKGIKGDAR